MISWSDYCADQGKISEACQTADFYRDMSSDSGTNKMIQLPQRRHAIATQKIHREIERTFVS